MSFLPEAVIVVGSIVGGVTGAVMFVRALAELWGGPDE